MKFYHGTSDIFKIKSMILPASQTGILREEFRTKLTEKVFVTFSVKSAEYYAKKACEKYGGNPVIYEVRPIGYALFNGGTEYICNKAKILNAR